MFIGTTQCTNCDISTIIRNVCNSTEFDTRIRQIVNTTNFWDDIQKQFKSMSTDTKIDQIKKEVTELEPALKLFVREYVVSKIAEHARDLPQRIADHVPNNTYMNNILQAHTNQVMNGITHTATQTLTALISHPDFNVAVNAYLRQVDTNIQQRTTQFIEANEGILAKSLQSHMELIQNIVANVEIKIKELNTYENKIKDLTNETVSLREEVAILKVEIGFVSFILIASAFFLFSNRK